MGLAQDAEEVLHVVADLVRDHIGIGEIAAAAELLLHVVEEGHVEIDLLVDRAIERTHGGLRLAAARARHAAVENEPRIDIGDALLGRQHLAPDGLGLAQHGGYEIAHLIARVTLPGAGPALRLRIARVLLRLRAALVLVVLVLAVGREPPWPVIISAPPIRMRGSIPVA